jgi:hypothetical protein
MFAAVVASPKLASPGNLRIQRKCQSALKVIARNSAAVPLKMRVAHMVSSATDHAALSSTCKRSIGIIWRIAEREKAVVIVPQHGRQGFEPCLQLDPLRFSKNRPTGSALQGAPAKESARVTLMRGFAAIERSPDRTWQGFAACCCP